VAIILKALHVHLENRFIFLGIKCEERRRGGEEERRPGNEMFQNEL